MALQRIASEDFVFSNEIVTNNCWRINNGNFDDEDSPSFGSLNFTNGNPNASPSNNLAVTNYYNGNPGNLQFSVATVNRNNGLGAIQNIVTGCKNTPISWGGSNKTSLTVVSIARGSYKSALLPGSFRLGTLTDNSNMDIPQILNCGRAYNVVNGTVLPGGGFTYGRSATKTVRGLFLPDVGLILLDSFPGDSDFTLRTEDPTPTTQVFIRARNFEYNYSMNPSFISGSTGDVVHRSFIENPQTYITTIGLYNDNNVLMAVAKLPKPFNKNFTTELSVKVSLNF
jgi:hypothetical protein